MTHKDPAERREYQRKWREANREKTRAYGRKCYSKTVRKKRPAYNRLKRYGLSDADYAALLVAQDNKCAICGGDELKHIDHCHDTGRVRGVLCHNCNVGLGHFRDNPETMALAIAYLERHLH